MVLYIVWLALFVLTRYTNYLTAIKYYSQCGNNLFTSKCLLNTALSTITGASPPKKKNLQPFYILLPCSSRVSHFNPLATVIPCQYRHKWYIAKNYILWSTFLLQKVFFYLQSLLRNPFRKLPNSVKLRGGYRYYVVQGHPRSPSLVAIESSYATCY